MESLEDGDDFDIEDHLEDEGATQRAPPDDEKRLNLRAPAARDLSQKYLISSWCPYIFPAPKIISHLKIAMHHQPIDILIYQGLQEYFHITQGS